MIIHRPEVFNLSLVWFLFDARCCGWHFTQIDTVSEILIMNRIWIVLLQVQLDVLHLKLVITFVSHALERFLTDTVYLVLQILNNLAVFLFTEDIVLLLVLLTLLQLKLLLERFAVELVVLLIESWPILCGHLQSYTNTIRVKQSRH